ncbi:YqhR family membrane protein [Paenibacillus nanensis]|nr:YqhR family membrane protein [Paenibacillus nanensis]
MSNQYVMHRGAARSERRRFTNPWLFPLEIGCYAGLFFGVIRWISYEMNFTRVLPGFLLDSFFSHDFLRSWWGISAGIACFIALSIVAALLYKVALGKFKGPWAGIFYGIGWWAVLFGLICPLLGMTPWMNKIGWNTIFTELSVMTVWGLFIGFSIAFEFTDEASREPMNA